ncbi:MAG: bacillithiol biosynthesis deacetylase BshB1 [Vicinamibacterales bacterium]
MHVDVLVFGPHPDDIEIGLGATVAKHVDLGYRVGLCDLTRGELGSNGTVEERAAEALAAAEVLGAAWRQNLGWAEGEIGWDRGHVRSAVELIRRARPAVIAIPYWRDQHPDHEAASRLLTDAAFRSGLRRYAAEGAAWKPEWVCHYFINDAVEPSFVIDVSDAYPRKQQALECHRSQFRPVSDDAVPTRLTGSGFRRMIEARDAHLGALAGVAHAEGVIVKAPVERSTLFRGAAGVPRTPQNGRTSS